MKKICLTLALTSAFVLSVARATTITENFTADPLQNGWQIFGDTNLFQWDSTNQNLVVTWDSSRTNSYFCHPLGTTATKSDNFSIAFDVRLDDIGPTSDPEKPYSFNLSIGLLNFGEATQPYYLRGTGYSSPDLAEFAYFWDSGYGATAWPVLVDSNSSFNFNGASDYAIFTLTNGDWYHVAMNYTTSNHTLVTTITNLAHNTGITITAPLDGYFTDLSVDTISISSYNDTDGYGGSIFAHGVVDNLVVTMIPSPIKHLTGAFSNNIWQVQFISQTNWTYTLERSVDFGSWSDASTSTVGNGTNLILQDLNAPADKGFYRVRAEQP